MKRIFVILLLTAIGLPGIAPLTLLGDAEAKLPACCRRGGMHDCMALAAADNASKLSSAISATRAKCPRYPQALPVNHHERLAPGPGPSLFASVFSHPASTADLNSPQFSIATRRQRSWGMEATAQGRIVGGLMATAAYSYTNAKVTKDNAIAVGSFLADVPRNQVSIWATYQIPFSAVRGLGIGFGDIYAGRRQASIPANFVLDSYNRLDASVSYERERWRASVNFKNLGSTRYYDVDGGYAIRPNAPLTVLGSIRKDF